MISLNVTLLFTVLNFILLVYILKAILFEPLVKYLDSRAATIDESLRLAEENQQRSEQIQLEREEIIKEARNQASSIVDKATANATEESRQILAEAREKAKATIDAATDEIQGEVERIKQELRRDIADMTVDLAGKVLEREIKADEHKDIIGKALDVLKD